MLLEQLRDHEDKLNCTTKQNISLEEKVYTMRIEIAHYRERYNEVIRMCIGLTFNVYCPL